MSQRKWTVLVLVLYWPVLFVLSHIPMPEVVREADMNDKTLHLLAYMILTFLLWSVVSPHDKVVWRKATVWWVLLGVCAYAVCDEGLQHFVAGRSMDAADLVADAGGTVAALGVLSFLSFWPASVVVAGTFAFVITVITEARLAELLPTSTMVFHFGVYACFAFLWIGCVCRSVRWRPAGVMRLVVWLVVPVALVVLTKVATQVSGKPFTGRDIAAALGGVVTAVAVVWGAGCRGTNVADNVVSRGGG
jgi:VanZ family protein